MASNAKDIYNEALLLPVAARPDFLEHACSDDTVLRARLEHLLSLHEQAPDFLAVPADTPLANALGARSVREVPGTVIGPYTLLQQIGEGGFGIVFLAEQRGAVRRRVALKIVKAGMDTRQVIARFEAERQALAMMDHPGIARVFDAGETDSGRPYFVMELVLGEPITSWCDAAALPIRQRLELFCQVCLAVQHAHQKGVIHRDLKPSNILVTEIDGCPSPRVIDFGIAKAADTSGVTLTDRTLFTGLRNFIGTPEYMSPEQAGHEADIDTRADIYSLGVLLYELVAGIPPLDVHRLRSAGWDELRRLIREEEPLRPSTRLRSLHELPAIAARRGTDVAGLRRTVRGELDWIIMQCLEKDRTRRYQTANALAMDLKRYLDGQPVLAAPASWRYRAAKLVRRHRLLVTSAAAILLVAAAAAITSTLLFLEMRTQRDTARAQRSEANEQRTLAEWQTYVSSIAAAEAAIRGNDVADARRRLDTAPPHLRNWEWTHLHARVDQSFLTLRAHGHLVKRIAVSPDHTLIASCSVDGTAILWHARTGELLRRLPAGGSSGDWLSEVAFSPDGALLATGGHDTTVSLWSVATGAMIARLRGHRAAIVGISWLPEAEHLITADAAGNILLWNVPETRILEQIASHHRVLTSIQLSPDGSTLAVADENGSILLLSPRRAERRMTLDCGIAHATCLSFTPDSTTLAAGLTDGSIRLWDVQSGAQLARWAAHSGRVTDVHFGPERSRPDQLFSCAVDSTIRIWDWRSRECLSTLLGHTTEVCSLALLSDPESDHPPKLSVVSSSNDHTVRLWSPYDNAVRVLRGHTAWVYTVAFSPDGSLIASGGGWKPRRDGSVRLWCARTLQQLQIYQSPVESIVWRVAFAPHSSENNNPGSMPGNPLVALVHNYDLVLIDHDASVMRKSQFEYETCYVTFDPVMRSITRLALQGPEETQVAADAVLSRMAVGCWGGSVHIVDPATLAVHQSFETSGWCGRMVFSPDGRLAAVPQLQSGPGWPERRGGAALLDAQTFEPVADIQHPTNPDYVGRGFTFSNDGRWLAVFWADRLHDHTMPPTVWDIHTARTVAEIHGHTDVVHAGAFNPAGDRLATVSADRTVRLWDIPSGREVLTLHAHGFTVFDVAFSPDGRRLATASGDGTIRIWETAAPTEPERSRTPR